MIEWYAYVMVAVLALSSAANILMIGRKRDPITPGMALATVAANGLLIWGVLALAV